MAYEEDNFTIDWSDTEFKKYKHTVKIVNEGWLYKVHESGWHERDNYYIRSDTRNVASTNGVTGFCLCESFKTAEPNENGDKKPCKHLIVCNERRVSWLEGYNESEKEKRAKDRKSKDDKICRHLKSAKDDPNSIFADETFVGKIIKKEAKEGGILMGKGHTKLLNEVKGNHKVKLKKNIDETIKVFEEDSRSSVHKDAENKEVNKA